MKRHLFPVSRFLYLVSCLLLLLPLLAGCGPAAPRSVSFMVFGDPAELAAYQQLVAAFREKYPNIQVELRHVAGQGDYQKQLVTAFSAGAPPDVMLLNYRRVAQFAAPGGLQPVGAYLEASAVIHESDFYPQTIEAFRWNGELWCIPQNISSLVVYYNRDLFDAAGLPYPAAGWTWDNLLQAARALTLDRDGDGIVEQYGLGLAPGLIRLAPLIWQNGGELVDDPAHPTRLALDSPEALAAFRWFVDLQVREGVTPDRAAEQAEGSESRFLNGRMGMYLNSRRGVPTYRTITAFSWDVAPLPRGRQEAGVLHSDGFCMAAKTRDKEAAWTFIEFANSAAGQEILAATGRTVPSLRAVAESPAFLDPRQSPANSRAFLDTIPIIRRLPLLPQWTQIEETANREIERAFYGEATVEAAAAAAIEATRSLFPEAGP